MSLPRYVPDQLYEKGSSGLYLPVYGISGSPDTDDVPVWDGDKLVFGPSPNAGTVPPWVEFAADSPQSGSNTEDDEFNSTSLDAKWTASTATGTPTTNVDTTLRSHYFMGVTSTAQCQIFLRQTYSNTDVSVTARFRMGSQGTSPPSCRLFIQDSSGNTLTDAMSLLWQGDETIQLQSRDGGVASNRASRNAIGYGVTSLILHLARTGNSFAGWFSGDGWAWHRVGTHSKTFTVAAIGVSFTSGSPAITGDRYACDWFRRDWLTLA